MERKTIKNHPHGKTTHILFVKPVKSATNSEHKAVILMQTGDWRLEVDLNQNLKFPYQLNSDQIWYHFH